MKSWRLLIFSCREIVKLSILPLKIFPSNYIDLLSVILQHWQKAEVNEFTAYRGKAHLNNNIREGMVGHQIVVLSFKTRPLDVQLLPWSHKFFRNDSPTAAGGASMYISKNLKTTFRPDIHLNMPLVESCWIKTDPCNNKAHITVGCIYQ